MSQRSFDLINVLAQIRRQAVTFASADWQEAGTLVDSILPDPLTPVALLPIATGIANGGKLAELIHAAAAVMLVNVSLQIIDDCADLDDPHALYQTIGPGRAINFGLALNSIALHSLLRTPLASDSLNRLMDDYFRSFLRVCQGQDMDMRKHVRTLPQYEAIVRLKTVTAYEFAAGLGAHAASAYPDGITLAADCGKHLGWMVQILDDVEALWFPVNAGHAELERRTYPVLWGLTLDHPCRAQLLNLSDGGEFDRVQICRVLDAMNVRPALVNLALDHRDKATVALARASNPEGAEILNLWLDWLLRDGARLLDGAT